MPRKTAAGGSARRRRRGSFNEAAARCRGKRQLPVLVVRGVEVASMRPRPDAAENGMVAGQPGQVGRALQ